MNDKYKKELLYLDSSSISDALDSLNIPGALIGIKPRSLKNKFAGPVFTVKYRPIKNNSNSYKNAGNYIDDVPKDHVVLIDNDGRNDCTNWGEILTHKAIRNSLAGTVIHGSCRDISQIKNTNYPIFSQHVFMQSGKNRVEIKEVQCLITINHVKINPNDWIFGDENGVVVIPKKYLEEVIRRAKRVIETEHKILVSIEKGASLKEAREKYGYATPWN